MTVEHERPSSNTIDPATEVGLVALAVADLARSIGFYTTALGFAVLDQAGGRATLGVDGAPLLLLSERPGARRWRGDATGLYHFAILLPSRADLGRWLRHWLDLGLPFPGQADHLVSEALYLSDPDGNGIEVYRDRPRETWERVGGQVRMVNDPLDIPGLLAAGDEPGAAWSGLPPGTRLGHIHLQVGDLAQAQRFYGELLGFEVMAQMPGALFVAAGGYHHHLGLNTWHSRGAGPAPENFAGLRYFTLALPSAEARDAVTRRLAAAGHAVREAGPVAMVADPWRTTIVLQAGPVPAPADLEATLA